MATKTISVDEDAYKILSSARRFPAESFSKVIKRATWKTRPRTCGELLALSTTLDPMTDEQIDYLEAAQKSDLPPVSKWNL